MAIQATSSRRAGRRFVPVGELSLEPDALRVCGSLPGARRGVLVVREMTGPIGIPDFTALVGPSEELRARLGLDVPPIINRVDASVVAACKVVTVRASRAIVQSLGWPFRVVEPRLTALVESGALNEVRPDRFVRRPELGPLGRIYAVETKVKDRGAGTAEAQVDRQRADQLCAQVLQEAGAGWPVPPLDVDNAELVQERRTVAADRRRCSDVVVGPGLQAELERV